MTTHRRATVILASDIMQAMDQLLAAEPWDIEITDDDLHVFSNYWDHLLECRGKLHRYSREEYERLLDEIDTLHHKLRALGLVIRGGVVERP